MLISNITYRLMPGSRRRLPQKYSRLSRSWNRLHSGKHTRQGGVRKAETHGLCVCQQALYRTKEPYTAADSPFDTSLCFPSGDLFWRVRNVKTWYLLGREKSPNSLFSWLFPYGLCTARKWKTDFSFLPVRIYCLQEKRSWQQRYFFRKIVCKYRKYCLYLQYDYYPKRECFTRPKY